MAKIETEVKIRVEDLSKYEETLERLGARLLHARYFEDNIILDDQNTDLGRHGLTLRVRQAGEQGLLTLKVVLGPDDRYKRREELESRVEDAQAVLDLFARLGLRKSFRYQKYRAEYTIGPVHICLDETPIGRFLELEGPQEGIDGVAEKLNLPPDRYMTESYLALYAMDCEEKDEPSGDMVFPEHAGEESGLKP